LGLASKNIADCDAVRAAIRRIEKQYGKREDGVPVGAPHGVAGGDRSGS